VNRSHILIRTKLIYNRVLGLDIDPDNLLSKGLRGGYFRLSSWNLNSNSD